ncbi:MAG: zinc-binding dehydrogenase, partial [Endomicrobiales bacterium]|nr:zinc-binding dehydrogenase [Endomicrobiales bacterium]
LACVVRAQRVAGLKAGQSVLILGAGISGLMHAALAKSRGAGFIAVTDVNKFRLQKAKSLGASAAIGAGGNVVDEAKKANGGKSFDLVAVCTGVFSVFEQALQAVDRGGTVLFFAPTDPGKKLEIPVNEFWRNEITLVTSYGAGPSDNQEALELIRDKRVPVTELITHRLPLADTGKGFKLVSEAKESIKVVIEPQK